MRQLFEVLIYLIIFAFSIKLIISIINCLYKKKKYDMNSRQYINTHIKLKKTPTYKKHKNILLMARWKISVEELIVIKWIIAYLILVLGFLVIKTNTGIETEHIRSNINYGRSSSELPLESTKELEEKEILTLDTVTRYIESNHIEPTDPLAIEYVEKFLIDKGITYDSTRIIAIRMLQKVIKLNEIDLDFTPYPILLFVAFIGYYLPNILIGVKITLIRNNKDWEMLQCMLAYINVASLPPYQVDKVIKSMTAVSRIYEGQLNRIGDYLYQNDKDAIEEEIFEMNDLDLEQICESLVQGKEEGVERTVKNVDNMLQNKIKWLEINATKKRQEKFMIAFIPAAVTLVLLFVYGMNVLNVMNQATMIDF